MLVLSEANRTVLRVASRSGDSAEGDALVLRPLLSKLRPPRPQVELVERRTLVARLNALASPLIVVSAPAGAGKTTALLQWAAASDRPSVWLHLEAADDDPVLFLTYLVLALHRVAQVGDHLVGLLQSALPPIDERVLPELAAALESADPFLFVLDDAQMITNPACWRFVACVLDHLPIGGQLALGTRVDPPLNLARMRAAGRVAEIRLRELSFDHAETLDLLRLRGPVADDDTADALLNATEGWATGLCLAALGGRDRSPEEWLGGVRGDHTYMAAFLDAEVLQRQSPDVQDFLLRTAILEQVERPVCRELSGRSDAGELLERLARENLFVTAVDDRAESFRYHQLFAAFLRSELQRRSPELASRLHRQAGEWYLAHESPERAVPHFLLAGDHDRAADVVATWWPRFWSRGHTETVRRWLEGFTDQQILDRPALTLTAGWTLSALGDARLGQRWATAACSVRVADTPSPDGAASLRSSQALLRATLAPDGVAGMRADAELAARLESAPGTSWFVDAQAVLGTARYLSGAARQALRPLQVAVREGFAFNPVAELAALGFLALICADQSEWNEAERYVMQADTRLQELGFGTYRRILPVFLARIRIAAHRDSPDVKRQQAQIAAILERMVPHAWMLVMATVMLGEVGLASNDPDSARSWSLRATEALRHYPDAGVFGARAERLRAAVEQMLHAEPLTPAERRILELLPTHLTEAQIAEHLFVSTNTVKTHLRGLYRKLEANSRAQAVERARELGLLKPL